MATQTCKRIVGLQVCLPYEILISIILSRTKTELNVILVYYSSKLNQLNDK